MPHTLTELVAGAVPIVVEETRGYWEGTLDEKLLCERLFAREVPAHHHAATLAHLAEHGRGDGTGRDVRVVDFRPYGLAALLRRDDLIDPVANPALNDREDLLDRAPGGRDTGPQGGLDLADRGGQVLRRGVPLGQGRQVADVRCRGPGHGAASFWL